MGNDIEIVDNLIHDAILLASIRHEVISVDKHSYVIGNKKLRMCGDYDIIIKTRNSKQTIKRILSNIPNLKIERIAKNVIGITQVRRSREK